MSQARTEPPMGGSVPSCSNPGMAGVVDRYVRSGPFAVAVVAGLLFVLIAYALFAFPSISEPGPVAVRQWLGADWLRWIYLAVALLMTGGYAAVALAARRTSGAFDRSAGVGVAIGVAAALLAGAVSVRSGMLATPADLQAGTNVAMLLFLVTPLAAVVVGVALTGRSAASVFWASASFAVLFATTALARDIVLADHLAHTAWVGDPTCAYLPANSLAACEIGDDLGGLALMLMVAPIPGAASLGATLIVGDLRRSSAGTGVRESATSAPVLFAALLVTLFVGLGGLGSMLLIGRFVGAVVLSAVMLGTALIGSVDLRLPAAAAGLQRNATSAPVLLAALTVTLLVVRLTTNLF